VSVVNRERTAPLTLVEPLHSVRQHADDGDYRPGDRIGPFRLVSEIGAGGMGVVFLAEQTEPLQRRVALKLISPNFADAYAGAMFMVERQALARLEHPHIARVYEAGATDDGALYFAMEWIDGERIDAHCRVHALDRVAIVQLMIAACRGVQHAHTRGVIHRDLKPANILIAMIDGVATPKIIDFGIASAPGQGAGTTLGTLGYMAPEQAQPGELIDQRADVYALGVVLLELLTASAGIDQESWWGLDAGAREQMLLTGAGSAVRQRDLIAHLPRDLRAILAQALRPDREQRYSGAEALAEDLQRYLRGFPVHARPRTRGYALARFVARHRYAVAGTLLVVFAVLALLINMTLAWRAAEREALKAAQTAQFLHSVLAGVDPLQAQELDRTLMRQVLDRAASRVDEELAGEPTVRAEVVRTIADTYRALGESALALTLIEPIHADLSRREGPEASATLKVEQSLLRALRGVGDVARSRFMASSGRRMAAPLTRRRRPHRYYWD
jgi:non-specific serine/threonine protein kinase/serine/threonine-protein kinase